MSLPPLYYGTIDATPLWICLLHDAWRAGLADAEVVEPAARPRGGAGLADRARRHRRRRFLEYLDASGRGLANQGWKDSADAVRFADGRLAERAGRAVRGPGLRVRGGDRRRRAAGGLRPAGRRALRGLGGGAGRSVPGAFWCERRRPAIPALALDGDKRRVDSLTSNIGHLLGTGLLNAEEERLVAGRVSRPNSTPGFGLRTMSAADGGYAPLSAITADRSGRTTPPS